jgi:hypothetical protein
MSIAALIAMLGLNARNVAKATSCRRGGEAVAGPPDHGVVQFKT